MSRPAVALWAVAAVLVAGGAGCSGLRDEAKAKEAGAKRPVLTVSVVSAAQKTVDDELRVIGTVVPREDVVVVSELSGLRVRSVSAEAGDRVKRGQPLALLDGESLSIQSDGLQQEVDRARDEYTRATTLRAAGAIADEVVQQRRAALEIASARLRDSQLHVSRANISSPVDGLIYERNAIVGGLASGGQPLFRIARDGQVEVEARVPETLVRRLRPAMPVSLKVAGDSDAVPGTVRLIAPKVDEMSRTVAVRIRLDGKYAATVGALCEVSITLDQVTGWVLPGTALLQDSGGAYVWQVGPESTVARKPVTVVLRTSSSAVVKEPLAGAPVVAKAGPFLKEGDLVAVVKE